MAITEEHFDAPVIARTQFLGATFQVSAPQCYLYNKSGYVCLSQSMFRMAGQTAGPIETKLETRTHVHPWSVSGKVDVKVIHVCVRE